MICKKVVLPILELLVCFILNLLFRIVSFAFENELNNRRVIKKSVDICAYAVKTL